MTFIIEAFIIDEHLCLFNFGFALRSSQHFMPYLLKISTLIMKSFFGIKSRNEKLGKELLSKLFTTMNSEEYLQQHQARMVSHHSLQHMSHNC